MAPMAQIIKLFDGIEAPYSDENKSFRITRDWCGDKITVDLVCLEPNDESISALMYTYQKFFEEQEQWSKTVWNRLSAKLVKVLNNDDDADEDITADDLKGMLKPYHVAITYRGNTNLFSVVNNRVEITYKVDDEEDLITYSICGSLEDGFFEFYANQNLLAGESVLQPYKASSGDWFEYHDELGAYTATIDLLGYDVDVLVEPNIDFDDADVGFENLEKILASAERLDELAREKILSVVKPEKIDQVKEMELSLIVCSNSERIEFSYSIPEANFNAIGTVDGFERVTVDGL